eukprot:CAMPEP_0198292900 /NCGR_PEP_ID=MMETSP1449-20131203/14615_1 /TAXON_ID=420275 /ORGANISM="Attheya septentrionalis, Strain CCMP2084" /LENGTH=74 /DNA_ID=CAMNT_0043992251 /DNA_START=181 /DNA_END=405 /DNA_ORIENTATION=+
MAEGGNDICLDCDRKTQKELPSENTVASDGMDCASSYKAVTECMSKHNGQVAPCIREWTAFKKCHNDDKSNQTS